MSKIKTDWRLPTIQELLTIIDYENNTNNFSRFKDTRFGKYWTCTGHYDDVYLFWHVNLMFGSSYYNYITDKNIYVRGVRTTKNGVLQWSKSSEEPMAYCEAIEYAKNLKTEVHKG